MADLAAWRALVEKELAGAAFDKLVQKTPEGVPIQPLYTEGPEAAPFARGATATPWRLCMRATGADQAAAELDAGADAVWCGAADINASRIAIERGKLAVLDPRFQNGPRTAEDVHRERGTGEMWMAFDMIAEVARGAQPVEALDWSLAGQASFVRQFDLPWRCFRVGTLPFHDAGADAADELALALSSLVAKLREIDAAGVPLAEVGPQLWAQVAVGRDTFGEVCKLRALRVLWHKVLSAAGVAQTGLDAIHAVCSSRTMSERDPWVNMLRVTTQVFAAALGGAQVITPLPFDAAFAAPSALGQRVARNTALVLREESYLGRVLDAAGGSYYIETRTDALAREAWSRFQAIERDGGVVALLRAGTLHTRLEASWAQRAAAIAKRKEPVLGVSEFANLHEKLPGAPHAPAGVHRDSEAFEALRARVEKAPPNVTLLRLGPPGEHRARVGFAENLFAVAGLAIAPDSATVRHDIVCICGSDERYATEAADAARKLKALGAKHVVLAGRPGAIETELRAAGVDAFVFVGCDVLATLQELLS
jgi:methylmalonyl-CoA mutase